MKERERIEAEIESIKEKVRLISSLGESEDEAAMLFPVKVVVDTCVQALATMSEKILVGRRGHALSLEAHIDDVVADIKSRLLSGDKATMSLADFCSLSSSAISAVGGYGVEVSLMLIWAMSVIVALRGVWEVFGDKL